MTATPPAPRKSFRPPEPADNDASLRRLLGMKDELSDGSPIPTEPPAATPVPEPASAPIGAQPAAEVSPPAPPPAPIPTEAPNVAPEAYAASVFKGVVGPTPKVSLTVRASQDASDKMDVVAEALGWSKNKALGKLVDYYAPLIHEILQREGPVGVLALLAKNKQST